MPPDFVIVTTMQGYTNYHESDQVKIHCTDKDQWLDAVIISRNQHGIVMTIENGKIRLTFKKMPTKNLYVSALGGYEFVYDPLR